MSNLRFSIIFSLIFVGVHLQYVNGFRKYDICTLQSAKTMRKTIIHSAETGDIPTTPASSFRKGISNIFKATEVFVFSEIINTILSPANADDLVKPIVVLGSGGKTGKLIVNNLIAQRVPVRPTYRGNIPNYDDTIVDLPRQVDVTNLETIGTAIAGASAVIFAASASRNGGTAEQVDYLGVANVAQQCILNKIPRLVVISSGAITRPDSLGFKFTNVFGRIMEYKLKGENALKDIYKNSNDDSLSYVIIRPGGLADNSPMGPGVIELNQGDTISGEINRADVAQCAVAAALSKKLPKRVTFEIYQADRKGPLEGKFPKSSGYERSGVDLGANYDILFEGLKSGDVVL